MDPGTGKPAAGLAGTWTRLIPIVPTTMVLSYVMGEDELELPDLVPGIRSTLPTPTPFEPASNAASTPRAQKQPKTAEEFAQAAMARHFTTPEGRASVRPASGTARAAHRRALLACAKHPKPAGRPPAGATWNFEAGLYKLADGSFIHDLKEHRRLRNAAHRQPKGVSRTRKPYIAKVNVSGIPVQAEYVGPV